MAKFTVAIPEVHFSYRQVEAETPEDAIIMAGDAKETYMEYSHTIDYGWNVYLDGELIRTT